MNIHVYCNTYYLICVRKHIWGGGEGATQTNTWSNPLGGGGSGGRAIPLNLGSACNVPITQASGALSTTDMIGMDMAVLVIGGALKREILAWIRFTTPLVDLVV